MESCHELMKDLGRYDRGFGETVKDENIVKNRHPEILGHPFVITSTKSKEQQQPSNIYTF